MVRWVNKDRWTDKINEYRYKWIKGYIERQKDIWIERQMDRKIDGQKDRWIERQMDKKLDGQRDRKIDRQKDRQTDRQKDRWKDRWLEIWMDRKIDRQIVRKIDGYNSVGAETNVHNSQEVIIDIKI